MVTNMNDSFKTKNQVSLFLSSFIMLLATTVAIKLLITSSPIAAVIILSIPCLCMVQALENINNLTNKGFLTKSVDKFQNCYGKIKDDFKDHYNQSDVFSYKHDDLFIERGTKYCINSVAQCFQEKEEGKLF